MNDLSPRGAKLYFCATDDDAGPEHTWYSVTIKPNNDIRRHERLTTYTLKVTRYFPNRTSVSRWQRCDFPCTCILRDILKFT